MNERIKELYKQAGLTMNNPLAYEQWYLDSLEEFAELIVQESIEVMKRHDYHGEWLGEKIREHFGVEE